jgi:hypothetical protein
VSRLKEATRPGPIFFAALDPREYFQAEKLEAVNPFEMRIVIPAEEKREQSC